MLDYDPNGGLTLDEDFHVELGAARAHEVNLSGGDATTEIFP